jgi:hypothetical protein
MDYGKHIADLAERLTDSVGSLTGMILKVQDHSNAVTAEIAQISAQQQSQLMGMKIVLGALAASHPEPEKLRKALEEAITRFGRQGQRTGQLPAAFELESLLEEFLSALPRQG